METATAMSVPPSCPPNTAGDGGGKYIPPAKRAMMNAGTYNAPSGSMPPSYPGGAQRYQNGPRRDLTDLSDRGPQQMGGGYNPSFGRGGPQPGRVQRSDFEDFVPFSGSGPKVRPGSKEWGFRDGRTPVREDENTIFKKDHVVMTSGQNFDSYESIPVEITGVGAKDIAPIATFQETKGVHSIVARNVERVKYIKPTPVQKYAIPSIFAGRDVMACAQTGSGKTAAFLFPVITKMLADGPPPAAGQRTGFGRSRSAYPVALVLSPTRELAIQTYEESRKFAFSSGVRTVVLYGGSPTRDQMFEVDKGCDICVATPGRLEDFLARRKVQLASVQYLVLDEADRMLDMGFEPKIRQIVLESDMPTHQKGRQTIMFSATFPREIQELAANFLSDYVFITVGRIGSTNDFILQDLIYVQEEHKERRLLQLLPECSEGLTLIFVETKRKADIIEICLLDHGFPATSIHGDRDQSEREYALQHFKSGRCPILVATDVAARGLDIPNIKRVINLDLPSHIDDYVHRIGRTGRAGNHGKATSFVNERSSGILRDLHQLLEESAQEVPGWFLTMVRSCASARNHFGKGATRRGGFGGRDIRHTEERSFHREGYGGRSGGGSGFDRHHGGGGGGGWMKNSHGSGPATRNEQGDDDGW